MLRGKSPNEHFSRVALNATREISERAFHYGDFISISCNEMLLGEHHLVYISLIYSLFLEGCRRDEKKQPRFFSYRRAVKDMILN